MPAARHGRLPRGVGLQGEDRAVGVVEEQGGPHVVARDPPDDGAVGACRPPPRRPPPRGRAAPPAGPAGRPAHPAAKAASSARSGSSRVTMANRAASGTRPLARPRPPPRRISSAVERVERVVRCVSRCRSWRAPPRRTPPGRRRRLPRGQPGPVRGGSVPVDARRPGRPPPHPDRGAVRRDRRACACHRRPRTGASDRATACTGRRRASSSTTRGCRCRSSRPATTLDKLRVAAEGCPTRAITVEVVDPADAGPRRATTAGRDPCPSR